MRYTLIIALIFYGSLTSACNNIRTIWELVDRNDVNCIRKFIDGDRKKAGIKKNEETLFGYAVRLNRFEVVKLLIKSGVDINQRSRGMSPLNIASAKGYLKIVKILIGHGANLNQRDRFGNAPISIASYKGHAHVVNLLVNNKANRDILDEQGRTPLFLAASEGHTNIVKILLEKGVNVNKKSANGISPLFIAAFSGHVEVVRLLLRSKADPLVRNTWYGETLSAMDIAKRKRLTRIMSELSKYTKSSGVEREHRRPTKNKYKKVVTGKILYTVNCAGCHQMHGKGIKNLIPPIINSKVIKNETKYLIELLIRGKGKMPSFKHVSDDEMAKIVNYLRKTWGGENSTRVSVKDIKSKRNR